MTYTLQRFAAGSYDLVLGDKIFGSVVRELASGADGPVCHAELLDDPPAEKRPHPFSRIDHTFGTLDAITNWLGGAPIMDSSKVS
jgi:hypothetical protein